MPLNATVLRDWVFEDKRQTFEDRDAMLYALSIGFGTDPMNEDELAFVCEDDPRTVPTMAAVLCHNGPWTADPRTGTTRSKVVHGEQRMAFHAPLPKGGSLVARSKVLGVQDKGADKGGLIHVERVVSDAATNQPIATIVQTSFCRADGGFDGSFGIDPVPHVLPDRPADKIVETTTRADQALWYRLNADRNPLHSDPAFAKRAGFPRPILHGLCTYGIAARLAITELLGHRPERLRSLDARFSSPVYPGETLRFEFWNDDKGLSFRAGVPARGVKVLDNGRALTAAA